MSCRKTADPSDMPFGTDSGGPKVHVLDRGPEPRGKGAIFGIVPSSKMHCNSESAENCCINYTMYIPTESVWPQQYRV